MKRGHQILRTSCSSLCYLWAISGLLVFLSCISLFAAEPRVVRVGAFNLYPTLFQAEDGSIKGFYVDFLDEIAKREGWKIEYVYGNWADGLSRIKTGEVDVLTNVAFTSDRAAFLDYGKEPLLTVWAELYVHEDSTIDSIREVNGKKIALMKGDFNAASFTNLVEKFGIPCQYVEYGNFEEVFKAIASRQVDGGVVNNTFGSAKYREYDLKSSGVIFNPFDIFLAVAKGKNSTVLSTLDKYLVEWRQSESSPYHQARERWSHGSSSTIRVTNPWAKKIVTISVAGLFVALAFIFMLRVQVRRKTAEIQKQLEELSQNRKLLVNLTNQVPGVVYQYRLYADGRSAFPYASQGMNDIYEVTPEEVQEDATQVFGRLHPDDYDQVASAIQESARTLETFYSEFRVILPRQGLRWRWSQAHPERMPDGGTLWHGIISDITDRKLAEEEKNKLEGQLQQAQKMESVGRLAGGVAHDFNNLLTVITGYACLGMIETDQAAPAHAKFEEISKAAEKSADLTRQLLAFARKQTIAPKVLDLNETVKNMLNMLSRLIGENIHLAWQPAKSLGQIKFDPSQIDQILANLCVNARDAIADVGKITIETGNITFDKDYCDAHYGFIQGEYVLLAVSDDGCGMDKETMAHIFEPFFTTKADGVGTGLGLATVYGIVKQNNGFINTYSEPGHGTTVRIYLPRFKCTEGTAARIESVKPLSRGQETILLVEDEPGIRNVTTLLLEMQGYRVFPASTPGEALELAKEHSDEIHMVMTDVVMPEMNGRDLTGNLLLICPNIKCLYMSGYTANVIAHHGVLDENINFISKPFSLADLSAKVREVLGQQTI